MKLIPGFAPEFDVSIIQPEGTGALRVLMMGEAGGRHESHDQLPFRPYAEAGSVLQNALRYTGYDRAQFTITNLVWWQPPRDWLDGAPWEYSSIRMSKPWNDKLIEERQPKCILALGGVAMRELTGMCGHRQGILQLRGFPVASHYPNIPVIGTYHPSYLRRGEKQESEEGAKIEGAAGRGMDLMGVLVHDIQYAVKIARDGMPTRPAPNHVLWGTRESLQAFYEDALAHPELPIAWDIENDKLLEVEDESEIVVKLVLTDEITQIQFSLRPGEAYVFHWHDSLSELIVKIMALANPKIGFNDRLSDRPILRRFLADKGHQVAYAGDLHDLMDMWHHAQPDLPKGLQCVTSFIAPVLGPWKHLNISNRGLYGAYDVEAPQFIYAKLPGDLRKLGIWEGYERHVLQLSRALDKITITGIPVNDTARLEFGRDLDQAKLDMEREVQALVPEAVCPIHPKTGWKVLPHAVKEHLRRWAYDHHLANSILADLRTLPDCVEAHDGTVYVRREYAINDGIGQASLETGQAAGHLVDKIIRWSRLESFNPNSTNQLKAYIEFKRAEEIDALVRRGYAKSQAEIRAKYKIPHDFKTDKETTAKRELLRLAKATGDKLFGHAVQIREFSKLKGTYVDGWASARDGRIHPSFGFSPATSQLSSTEPNAQNVPSEKSRGAAISPTIARLAARFRRIIEAPDGYTLLEFDWRAFHALTLGFVAQDASYMRLARLDIHSFFAACGLLKIAKGDQLLAKPDDELREYLAWVKKSYPVVRDGQAKPAILGYGLGMRGYTLWQQNPESFSGRIEADRVLNALDGQFPVAAQFRRDVLIEASQGNNAHGPNCLILKPWSIRRFWSVFENKPVKDSYQPKKDERMFRDGKGNYWKVGHGSDAEAAISFYVQNSAHGHLKENLLAINENGWLDRYGLCNTVHDAFWFCCRNALVEECVAMVKPQMEAPSKYLINPVAPGGLWCEVDVSTGKSMESGVRKKFEMGVIA